MSIATKCSSSSEQFISIPFLNSPLPAITRGEKRARRETLAYHEAAHVVAAEAHGIALKPTAAAISGECGQTFFEGDTVHYDGSSVGRAKVEGAIIVLLAGAAAQRKRAHDFDAGRSLAHADYEAAKKLIEVLTPATNDDDFPWHGWGWSGMMGGDKSELQLYLRLLEFRAERFVSANWKTIDLIAQHLITAGKISAADAARLIVSQEVRPSSRVAKERKLRK